MFGILRPASGKDEAQAGQAEAHAHEQAYENIDRFHRFLRQNQSTDGDTPGAQSQ